MKVSKTRQEGMGSLEEGGDCVGNLSFNGMGKGDGGGSN